MPASRATSSTSPLAASRSRTSASVAGLPYATRPLARASAGRDRLSADIDHAAGAVVVEMAQATHGKRPQAMGVYSKPYSKPPATAERMPANTAIGTSVAIAPQGAVDTPRFCLMPSECGRLKDVDHDRYLGIRCRMPEAVRRERRPMSKISMKRSSILATSLRCLAYPCPLARRKKENTPRRLISPRRPIGSQPPPRR